nr:helicase HerA-like domain-containing protein [Corallococcus soli]
MLAADAQVIAVDAVGIWWSLRSSADGKRGGLPIVIFGGQHADVPLPPRGGKAIAQLLASRRVSAVLDVSELTDEELVAFLADFAEAFFHAKKRHRSPVHLFLEEAQLIIPEVPESKGAVRMRAQWIRLMRLGRNFGVGWTVISQQPQDTSKRGLNQAGTVFAMRTVGAHEKKAIAGWVSSKVHRQDALALLDKLPTMETGEAHVWSPSFLKVSKAVRISRRVTFDSSDTPAMDAAAREPRTLAPVEMAGIRTALQEMVSEAENSDPAILRARVAALQQQLAQRPVPAEARVEVPVLSVKERAALEKLVGRASVDLEATRTKLDGLCAAVEQLAGRLRPLPHPVAQVHAQGPRPGRASPPAAPVPQGAGRLPKGARDMLVALAGTLLPALTRNQVATLSGLKVTGGTFNKYLSLLRTSGFIQEAAQGLALTDRGLAEVGGRPPVPQTTEGIVAVWNERLPAGARAMLAELVRAHPRGLGRDALAERVNIEASGGTFAKYLSLLRSNGLLESASGELRASATLFPGVAQG